MKHITPYRLLKVLLMILILLPACGQADEHGRKRRSDPTQVEIRDYGKALFSVDTSDLQAELKRLKHDYAFFLGADLDNPYNILQVRDFVQDPFLRDIYASVREVYPDYDDLEKKLSKLFDAFHEHFPDARLPQVYTYISGLHYEAPVNLVDSVLLIAIDLFMGEDALFYKRIGMPRFIAQRCTPDHVLPLSASVLSYSQVQQPIQGEDLISLMINQGRLLYVASRLLPGTPEHLIIGYTPAQFQWCVSNQEKTWAFLVDKDLLFSTDVAVIGKFMRDGPFTVSFPEESPARLGWWIGWKIVQAYMQKHPQTSIQELLNITDAHAFLQASSYKPR